MPCIRQKPTGRTKRGTVKGYLFTPLLGRRAPVSFVSMVPHKEGYKNPRYIKFEEAFAKVVEPQEVHDCYVSVGKDRFLVAAYWAETEDPNPAVKMACGGLEWRGELAVVQAGRFVTFYKRIRHTSAVKKVVAKYVSEFVRCMAVGDPFPTSLVAS